MPINRSPPSHSGGTNHSPICYSTADGSSEKPTTNQTTMLNNQTQRQRSYSVSENSCKQSSYQPQSPATSSKNNTASAQHVNILPNILQKNSNIAKNPDSPKVHDADELMEHGILLTLENIFDNKPSVTYNPSPCRVEELQTNFITNCIFTIYDADGMDRNILRIQVNGQYNEADIFDFEEFGETRTYEKEYKLRIKKPLHYEERAVCNLDVSVHDTSNNTGNIFAILEVIDLPNRDPIWVRPLTTATFDEKQEQFFTLNAIDGDTGINKPICYRLEFEEDYSELMSINKTTGVLHVVPIDRDILQQQIFNFYTCAYKCDNSSWFIKNTTILIVQDINDHIPEIIMEPNLVQILEQKYLTLPMDKFIIEDIDLGINATYKAYLMTTNGISYSEAFSLVPNSGYQQTNFSLTVLKADQLDYEIEEWRNFDIMICAEEVENSARRSNRTLRIELINWNDEWPIFMFDSYEVNIMENVTKGTFLKQIYARDRDFGDRVNHSIVGNMSGLEINTQAGVIFTSHDNVFDYERQTTVLVQIQAKDTLITEHSKTLHTVFAQLTINIIDVNDETPQLRMPRAIVNITENAAPSTLLTDKIEVRDADTTANLTLEILWNATYATKSGQEVQSELFINCLLIESEAESKNVLNGLLRVNPAFEAQVDYEKYDTIFLTIQARDLNQEINEDTVIAVLTIRVDDVNDNPPNFKSGTLEEPRKVTEMETISTVIGSIEAFDIDGPGNNNFTFDLRSIGNLTENYLISINNGTGVLRVNGSIQCDVPRIFHLEYEIVLNDGVYTTIGKINISIIDINNRVPETDTFEQQVKIYENATTGEIVGQIKAFDRDRDFPHNALEFSISSAISDIHNLFEINATTGIVKVNLRNGLHLDRDNGITYHYIPVDVKDNFNFNNRGYGPVNQISTFLNISLLDVNDNAPIMPAKFLFSPEFSESDTKDTLSKIQLIAEDKDEYNTSNSWLSYNILDIRPASDNADNLIGYEDLFGIIGDNRAYGQLTSLKPLKGFYGIWQIEIEAFDHGTPTLRNASKYEILVRPYNFHAPTIIFPVLHKTIRLCHSLQEPNRPLFQADCVSRLPHFEAFDPDGGEYGDINFLLSSDVGHDKYFQLSKNSRNQSSLYLQELVPAGIYYLNIRATDGGGSSSEDIRNLKIVFVDMLGNPMFLEREFYTNFTENDDGLTEERLIPEAFDPKNEGLNLDEEPYKLYYFIEETFMPENAELFQLNKETRVLKLAQMLDREAIEIYRLRIKVTNSENGLISNPNSVNYTMDIIINVVINPVLKVTDYSLHKHPEGCMSVRGFTAEVERYDSVILTGLDRKGAPLELKLNGWNARIAQHEMDPLNGKLYIDTMDRATFACTCWQVINNKGGRVEIPFYK
ncbi:protocadherin Fat 3-like [Teleopsis dalmanni]|uniref:protocadherin Fat 3-like n=1 Tax=Teleopsis dalmanni TaxID=139649 RepID=UPI0018CE1DD3|nr:protocadherin Fat 3-like [Teleopsis dalmanni]